MPAIDPYVNIYIRVVMQSIELCKAIVFRASLSHGSMALKGSRALHNYSVLRNCNNASGA